MCGCANNTEETKTTSTNSKADSAVTYTEKGVEDTAQHTKNQDHKHQNTTAAGGSTKYTIETPAGWTKTADTIVLGGGKYVQLTAPAETGVKEEFRQSINVITEKLLKLGLDNYFSSGKENMLRHIPGLHIIKEGSAALNGKTSKWMKYGFMYGPAAHTNIVYMLVNDDIGYSITCNAETNKYDRYEPVFIKTVNSFKITE